MVAWLLKLHARMMYLWYDAEYSAIMPGSPYAERALENRAYWRNKHASLKWPKKLSSPRSN